MISCFNYLFLFFPVVVLSILYKGAGKYKIFIEVFGLYIFTWLVWQGCSCQEIYYRFGLAHTHSEAFD